MIFYYHKSQEPVWLGVGGFKYDNKQRRIPPGIDISRGDWEYELGRSVGWYFKIYLFNYEFVWTSERWKKL